MTKDKKKKLAVIISIILSLLISYLAVGRFSLLTFKGYQKAMQGVETLNSKNLSSGDVGFSEILTFLRINNVSKDLQNSISSNDFELRHTNNSANSTGYSIFKKSSNSSIFWGDLNQLKSDLKDCLKNILIFYISIIIAILGFIELM